MARKGSVTADVKENDPQVDSAEKVWIVAAFLISESTGGMKIFF